MAERRKWSASAKCKSNTTASAAPINGTAAVTASPVGTTLSTVLLPPIPTSTTGNNTPASANDTTANMDESQNSEDTTIASGIIGNRANRAGYKGKPKRVYSDIVTWDRIGRDGSEFTPCSAHSEVSLTSIQTPKPHIAFHVPRLKTARLRFGTISPNPILSWPNTVHAAIQIESTLMP